MKKSRVLWVLLDLIFLIIFNLVFFMLAGAKDHPASVWISYGFIHFAYLMMLLTPVFVTKGKSAAVFGYPLHIIASMYFILELIIGVIFILLHPKGWKAALLIQVILFAVYAVAMLVNMLANENTAAREARIQNDLQFVRTAAAQLESMMRSAPDRETGRMIEKAYDAARNCQVKSSPNLAPLENGMMNQIGAIQRAVFSGNKEDVKRETDLFVRMASERERQLRNM